MMPNEMDALCACCAQPTQATTFPAVCVGCKEAVAGADVILRNAWIYEAARWLKQHDRTEVWQNRPDPWLEVLTVGDAAFLHEMKIDPLG